MMLFKRCMSHISEQANFEIKDIIYKLLSKNQFDIYYRTLTWSEHLVPVNKICNIVFLHTRDSLQ